MDVYYVNSLIEEMDLNPTLRFEVLEDGLRNDIVVTVSNKEHLYQFSIDMEMLNHYHSNAIKDVIKKEVDYFVASSIEEQEPSPEDYYQKFVTHIEEEYLRLFEEDKKACAALHHQMNESQTVDWDKIISGDFLPNWDWRSDRWSTPDKKTEEPPKVPVCECGSQYSSIKTHHYDWCPLFKKKSNK